MAFVETTTCGSRLITTAVLLIAAAAASAQSGSEPIEDLLLGTWVVAERVLDYDNAVIRHIDGKIHIADRNPDGTFRVLVRLNSHIQQKDGFEGTPVDCDGKRECILAGATEGVGVYSNGRFFIDYFDESWYDDVFTITGRTMSGRDPNGPIVLEKVDR